MSSYRIGSRGGRVTAIQKSLIENLRNPNLISRVKNEMGRFGSATEEATRYFQKQHNLISDGIVGNFTKRVLFFINWSYTLRKPRKILQSKDLCWASTLEAMLERIPRPNRTVEQLVKEFDDHVNENSLYLTLNGVPVVARKYRLGSIFPQGAKLSTHFYAEFLIKFLRSGYPLWYLRKENGKLGHMKLLYGIRVIDGVIELKFMDPLSGYTNSNLFDERSNLQNLDIFAPMEILKK